MAKPDTEQVKSKRQLMTERMQSRYPDKDFSDEESLYGQIYDDYDEYDKNISGYQEREKSFSDMFTSDPRSARFLTDWRNGEDPVIGLVRQFGTDIKEAIDDPEVSPRRRTWKRNTSRISRRASKRWMLSSKRLALVMMILTRPSSFLSLPPMMLFLVSSLPRTCRWPSNPSITMPT